MSGRRFQFLGGDGAVEFTDEVLLHMYAHAQRGFFACEAGGQLFSHSPHHQIVQVTHITGPNRGDRRTRHRLDWDEAQANEDRAEHFRQGRHPVGLWHTHPEALPRPSGQDETTTQKYLAALSEEMKGFLLIIGNKGAVPAMTVWLAQSGGVRSWVELHETEVSAPGRY
jgi:integrative and conjugative element protein (TIGR02256 family)